MPTIAERIKSSIGRFSPFRSSSPAQQAPQTAPPNRVNQPESAGTDRQEEQDPDDALLDGMSFDLPVHARFLNGVKNVWRVIGPPTFVIFTAWEVFYYMNHFLQASDFMSKVLLWGITLLIEVPFMIATFDQAERKRVRA